MEGDRRVTLLEPNPATEAVDPESGQVTPGAPREHEWFATRTDRGGGEGIDDEALVGRWVRLYRGRVYTAIAGLTNNWTLRDEDGVVWDIEAVSEQGQPYGARWWLVQCIRRT